MFITIEGIDGTGKSTLARGLADALGAGRVVLTREPTDASPWGRRLRSAATEGRLSRAAEIDHFHRDRLHHIETVIKPALGAGKIVICDRYVDSMLAYQAKDAKEARALYESVAGEILEPEIVFILECPVELALERIAKERGGRTRFELASTLERASRIYASLEGARYHRLDAARPPADVLADALAVVQGAASM